MALKLVPAVLALGFAAALATAPLAAADASDFLDELSINGVSVPGMTSEQIVSAGQGVCSNLSNGASILDEMDSIEQGLGLAPGMGALFVSASTTNLCPGFAG
ncbi:MAG: DUF732 domain-containing protein [Mycobacterium sp.]